MPVKANQSMVLCISREPLFFSHVERNTNVGPILPVRWLDEIIKEQLQPVETDEGNQKSES